VSVKLSALKSGVDNLISHDPGQKLRSVFLIKLKENLIFFLFFYPVFKITI
jgi:hypothetical protein